MKLRQVIIVSSGIALILGSVGLMIFLFDQKEEQENEAPPLVIKAVKTEPVEYSRVPTVISAFGRVVSDEAIDIISEKSGKILRQTKPLKPGRDFRKGELLFSIDNTEERLNLNSTKSNFLKDLASVLPDFKIDFPESYDIWLEYFKSIEIENELPKLPEYKNEKEKTFLATKNILSAYYNIKSIETSLQKYKVYAPFKGTITDTYLQAGSFVNPGGRVIRIIRTDRTELSVAVAIDDIQWIKEGNKAKIYDENSNVFWTGKVTRIGDFVNQNTQSIDVYISLNQGDNKIYDGQYLRAELEGETIENGAILPREAVFEGSKVYVLADTVLKVKKIEIMKTNENTIVYNGLKAGSDLVIEPLVNAYNNMPAKKLGAEGSTVENSTVKTIKTTNKE